MAIGTEPEKYPCLGDGRLQEILYFKKFKPLQQKNTEIDGKQEQVKTV